MHNIDNWQKRQYEWHNRIKYELFLTCTVWQILFQINILAYGAIRDVITPACVTNSFEKDQWSLQHVMTTQTTRTSLKNYEVIQCKSWMISCRSCINQGENSLRVNNITYPQLQRHRCQWVHQCYCINGEQSLPLSMRSVVMENISKLWRAMFTKGQTIFGMGEWVS